MEVIALVDQSNFPVCVICGKLINNHGRVRKDTSMRSRNFFQYKGVNYRVHFDCKKTINSKTIKSIGKSIDDMLKHSTYHRIVMNVDDTFHSKKSK